MVVSSFCFSPCKFTSFEIMKSKTPEICIAFAINNCIVDNVSCSIPISATKRDEISLAFRSVAFSSPAIYIIWAHNNNERVFSFYFQHFCYEVHFFWREVIYQMIKQVDEKNYNLVLFIMTNDETTILPGIVDHHCDYHFECYFCWECCKSNIRYDETSQSN